MSNSPPLPPCSPPQVFTMMKNDTFPRFCRSESFQALVAAKRREALMPTTILTETETEARASMFGSAAANAFSARQRASFKSNAAGAAMSPAAAAAAAIAAQASASASPIGGRTPDPEASPSEPASRDSSFSVRRR